MKKRILSIVSSVIVLCFVFTVSIVDVQAMDNEVIQVDGSYLTTQDTSIGKSPSDILRGEYLMDGECSITKAGRNRIYVYAATTADSYVDYVAAIIYVDRYNEKTEKWEQIDNWMVEDRDTYFIATSKTITVDRGYYYRVHAEHFAGMDTEPLEETYSFTDGILVP
ncbi:MULTISPECIES: DUF6147 family protein [Lachnospiraceae]|uniref:DUF6147 family protein n=1 Tax=Faecalicatena acetigenes TaxID=2981790 RepID=A0ABT2TE80_9FIRM|nr:MULTISPECIES: DUF6147 family protein [Lachnospiraceae]MCU6748091.1 DUF6147 family protein [Faecalicatena acetigenes]SCI25988.1 Uncharacterised protein [uncultured Clostridium sp.]